MASHFDETGEFPMPFMATDCSSEFARGGSEPDEGDDGNVIDSGDEA